MARNVARSGRGQEEHGNRCRAAHREAGGVSLPGFHESLPPMAMGRRGPTALPQSSAVSTRRFKETEAGCQKRRTSDMCRRRRGSLCDGAGDRPEDATCSPAYGSGTKHTRLGHARRAVPCACRQPPCSSSAVSAYAILHHPQVAISSRSWLKVPARQEGPEDVGRARQRA